jgi:hypothetical protein
MSACEKHKLKITVRRAALVRHSVIKLMTEATSEGSITALAAFLRRGDAYAAAAYLVYTIIVCAAVRHLLVGRCVSKATVADAGKKRRSTKSRRGSSATSRHNSHSKKRSGSSSSSKRSSSSSSSASRSKRGGGDDDDVVPETPAAITIAGGGGASRAASPSVVGDFATAGVRRKLQLHASPSSPQPSSNANGVDADAAAAAGTPVADVLSSFESGVYRQLLKAAAGDSLCMLFALNTPALRELGIPRRNAEYICQNLKKYAAANPAVVAEAAAAPHPSVTSTLSSSSSSSSPLRRRTSVGGGAIVGAAATAAARDSHAKRSRRASVHQSLGSLHALPTWVVRVLSLVVTFSCILCTSRMQISLYIQYTTSRTLYRVSAWFEKRHHKSKVRSILTFGTAKWQRRYFGEHCVCAVVCNLVCRVVFAFPTPHRTTHLTIASFCNFTPFQ